MDGSIDLVLPAPHPGQAPIFREFRRRGAKYLNLVAGRGWGKTFFLGRPLVNLWLQGYEVAWFAPVWAQAKLGFDLWATLLGPLAKVDRTNHVITCLLSGGKWIFKGLGEPENIRGLHPHGIVMDEAAKIPEYVFAEIIQPMAALWDAMILMGSSPFGYNWFQRRWEAGRSDPKSLSVQAPALGGVVVDGRLYRKPHPLENPFFKWENLKRQFNDPGSTVAAFRQEILAEFVDNAAVVFPYVQEAIYQPDGTPWISKNIEPDNRMIVAGLDTGRVNDFTVITGFDAITREMVYFDRFSDTEQGVQIERCKTFARRYRPTIFRYDNDNLGAWLAYRVQDSGIPMTPFQTNNETKRAMIENLQAEFEHKRIKLQDNPFIAEEFRSFRAERMESGRIRYSAPKGKHDDIVFASGLAALGFSEPWQPFLQAEKFDLEGKTLIGIVNSPERIVAAEVTVSRDRYQVRDLLVQYERDYQTLAEWCDNRHPTKIVATLDIWDIFAIVWSRAQNRIGLDRVITSEPDYALDPLLGSGKIGYQDRIGRWPDRYRELAPEGLGSRAVAHAIAAYTHYQELAA